jgi:flavin reductase ActVB
MTLDSQRFRDVMAIWPSGVAVVAVREEGRVIATTVSALLSLSLEPPRVLVALGPNATVRPFLQPGVHFGISVLGAEQRRLAMVFADAFPVGADPFEGTAEPLVAGAASGLACSVVSITVEGDHAIVIAAVHAADASGGAPLVRYRRGYHSL